jgi:dolichol-phosphate mannosyltransferase
MQTGQVCILLPVLNEVGHVHALWTRIASAMGERPFRVCFVDDGSRDGTLEALRSLECSDARVYVMSRTKKQRGSQRGSALYAAMNWGLTDDRNEVFVEMDGDLSHQPEELPRGLALVDSGTCDVAIASKYLPGSKVTNRPIGRRAVSFGCNLAVRALLAPSVGDYSNGYRFYNRYAAELLSSTRIRYGSPIYLTEAMAIWLGAGLRIDEFASVYIGRNEGLSKLRKRDLIKALLCVFEIAFRYRVGFQLSNGARSVAAAPTKESDAEALSDTAVSTTRSAMTCVACHAPSLRSFVKTAQIKLFRCTACGSLTALPRPGEASLTSYHDAPAYFEHPYFERRRRDIERVDARCRDLFHRLRDVDPGLALSGMRHLDVGCDTGLFLERFSQRYGTASRGVEINAQAVALARARGLDVQHSDLARSDTSCIDLVTMIDVIEHVADPIGLLVAVRSRLRPKGLVYLETPNIESVIYVVGRMISNLTGGRPALLWERLFLPEHVQYLSRIGLEAAAQAAGFRVVALTRRCLSTADINSFRVVTAGVMALQAADRVLRRQILHCAILTA